MATMREIWGDIWPSSRGEVRVARRAIRRQLTQDLGLDVDVDVDLDGLRCRITRCDNGCWSYTICGAESYMGGYRETRTAAMDAAMEALQ